MRYLRRFSFERSSLQAESTCIDSFLAGCSGKILCVGNGLEGAFPIPVVSFISSSMNINSAGVRMDYGLVIWVIHIDYIHQILDPWCLIVISP